MLRIVLSIALSCGFVSATCANLVRNGDFEEWKDGTPTGWNLSPGAYRPEHFFIRSGKTALRMNTIATQTGPWLYNLVSQIVILEPHCHYRLSASMAQNGVGTTLFDLIPLSGTVQKPSIASFNTWSWGFPYTTVSRNFETGAETRYLLQFNHIGNTDNTGFLDAVSIEKLDTPPPDKRQPGIYQASVMIDFSGELPPEAVPLTDLSFINCRNETESRNIFLKAPEAISSLRLVVKNFGDLPPEAITLFDLYDGVLPPTRNRSLQKNAIAAFQVAVRTTPDMSPGKKKAVLALLADDQEYCEIPLEVQIVDILLPDAKIAFLMYHDENYLPDRFITPALRKRYYLDMAAHGMNTVTLYNNPHQLNGKIDLDFNAANDPALIPEHHREWSSGKDPNGQYVKAKWEKIFNFGLSRQITLLAECGLLNRSFPFPWLVSRSGVYGWGGMPTTALAAALAEWRKHMEWPEPLLYVLDEPYDIQERIEAAEAIFRNLRSAGIKVRTVTAHPNPDLLGSQYDVWILHVWQVTEEYTRKSAELQKEIWCYNCTMPNTNGAFFRALYGFWAYRSKVKGIATWAYYDAFEGFTENENGQIADRSRSRLSRVGLSKTGPISTVAWEGTREGTEDYRLAQLYFSLLQTIINEKETVPSHNSLKSSF